MLRVLQLPSRHCVFFLVGFNSLISSLNLNLSAALQVTLKLNVVKTQHSTSLNEKSHEDVKGYELNRG